LQKNCKGFPLSEVLGAEQHHEIPAVVGEVSPVLYGGSQGSPPKGTSSSLFKELEPPLNFNGLLSADSSCPDVISPRQDMPASMHGRGICSLFKGSVSDAPNEPESQILDVPEFSFLQTGSNLSDNMATQPRSPIAKKDHVTGSYMSMCLEKQLSFNDSGLCNDVHKVHKVASDACISNILPSSSFQEGSADGSKRSGTGFFWVIVH
jgi:hypothetical protein